MNKYDIAAAFAVEGLDDGKVHNLSADEQRRLFGFAVLGRKNFKVDTTNQGTITLYKKGMTGDTLFHLATLAEMANLVNARQPFRF